MIDNAQGDICAYYDTAKPANGLAGVCGRNSARMSADGRTALLDLRRGLRERFGDRAFILRWQLRIASQCDSPALRSIIAGNIERLGGKQ